MEKINFENYPSTNSPINGTNLNLLQDNVENDLGLLSNLNTNDKSNLVNAINETITNIKMITETRTSTASTESISYTGIGFKPKFLMAFMVAPASLYNSKGFCDENSSKNIYQCAETSYRADNSLITYSNYSSWAQSAVLSSFDNDGFTLNWTKISTPPTSELNLIFIAFK